MSHYPSPPPQGYPPPPPQGYPPPPPQGYPSPPPQGYPSPPPQGYPPPPPQGYAPPQNCYPQYAPQQNVHLPPQSYPSSSLPQNYPPYYPPSNPQMCPSHPSPQGFPSYPSHPSQAHTPYPPKSYNPHSPSPHSPSAYAPCTCHHYTPLPPPSHSLPSSPSPPPQINLLGSQYVHPYETTLVLRENCNWSPDDMEVTDVTGVSHFTLRAQLVSAHKKRTIYDNRGGAICSTMTEILTNTTLICLDADPKSNRKIAKVRKVIFSSSPQAHVFFNGNKSPNPDIMIKGSMGEKTFEIANSGGLTLAEVTRNYSSAEARLYGKDTYNVRIFPGVDTALMVVLVTIIEGVFVGPNQK